MKIEEIEEVIANHPSELIRFIYKNGKIHTFLISEIHNGYLHGFSVDPTDFTKYDESPMYGINPEWVSSIESTGVPSERVTTLEYEDDEG